MSSMTRRTALKAALGAAAAGAAPFNILKAGPSPNSKLNVAVIGVGRQGSGNALSFANSENVVALCD